MPNTPGIVSYTETVWNTATTPKTVVVSWSAGDIVVCVAGEEGETVPPVPTGSGITFVSQKSNATVGTCGTNLSVAQPIASGSGVTISGASGGGFVWGYGVFVINGASGAGTAVEQHTTTKTVALDPLEANSLIIWGCFDFEAAGAVTPTPTTPTVITRHSENVSTKYALGVFSMSNQTSPSSVSYGGVFGGVAGPYSIIGLEVKGLGMSQRSKGSRLQPGPFKPGHYHNAKYNIKD